MDGQTWSRGPVKKKGFVEYPDAFSQVHPVRLSRSSPPPQTRAELQTGRCRANVTPFRHRLPIRHRSARRILYDLASVATLMS